MSLNNSFCIIPLVLLWGCTGGPGNHCFVSVLCEILSRWTKGGSWVLPNKGRKLGTYSPNHAMLGYR
ncbi:hypothetical protein CHARACLAT_025490 [Characodon lateralis]|uniref:Secreted protein n=1 Tax=Characodon lateralis TaxID=208331 RepID=A0ABU7DCN7_9TELE|nr:hypothetical protein [Characodon lateralis]